MDPCLNTRNSQSNLWQLNYKRLTQRVLPDVTWPWFWCSTCLLLFCISAGTTAFASVTVLEDGNGKKPLPAIGHILATTNQPRQELLWAAEPWPEWRELTCISLSLEQSCPPLVTWPQHSNGRKPQRRLGLSFWLGLLSSGTKAQTTEAWQQLQKRPLLVQANLYTGWHQL